METKQAQANLRQHLEEIKQNDQVMAAINAALAEETAVHAKRIAQRQAGKGIEALFTTQDIDTMTHNLKPVRPDLSGQTHRSQLRDIKREVADE